MEENTFERDQIGKRIQQFVSYGRTLKGDEKGEAQVFCDRLFQPFGHAGYKEAGATLEFRVKGPGKTDTVLAESCAFQRFMLSCPRLTQRVNMVGLEERRGLPT